MKIGRKIFYDKNTGEVIVNTGERQGSVIPTTIEQDITVYKSLSERNRNTFDYVQLEYGQYAQDFMECNGYHVDVSTKEILFSYPNPNETENEPVYQKPLSEEIIAIKKENTATAEYALELDFRLSNIELGI